MRFIFTLFLCIAAGIPFAAAVSEHTDDKNGDGKLDTWIVEEEDNVLCLTRDSNYDGYIDYLLRTDTDNKRIYEEIDFNHDGQMDDFYFYTDGVLARRELDSNYDGAVDIWVYLTEGVYIEKYARDKDYDGVIDVEKIYTADAEE